MYSMYRRKTKKYVQFYVSVDPPSEMGLLLYYFKFLLLRDLKYHTCMTTYCLVNNFINFHFVLFHKPISPY